MYKDLKDKTIDDLKEKFPEAVDENGTLVGAVNTNAMEGGNFRTKWNLRVPYKDIEGIFGRTILSTIYESIYTFRNGKPNDTYAQIHTTFQYGDGMNWESPPEIVGDNSIDGEKDFVMEEEAWYESMPVEEYLALA